MRSFSLVLVFCFLLLPQGALATYSSPSELLRDTEFKSGARNFSLEAHVSIQDVYAATWISGAMESTAGNGLRATTKGTFDIHNDGITIRSTFHAITAGPNLYVYIDDMLNLETQTTLRGSEDIIDTWISMPTDAQLGNLPIADIIGTTSEELTSKASGLGLEDIDFLGRSLLDTAFAMESEGFEGGNAYHVSMQPQFLGSLLQTMDSINIDGLEGHSLPQGDVQIDDMQVQLMQAWLNDALDIQVKVDTDEQGNFQFGRTRIALDLPHASLNLVTESELRTLPVSVEVPEGAVSADQILAPLHASLESWVQNSPLAKSNNVSAKSEQPSMTPARPRATPPAAPAPGRRLIKGQSNATWDTVRNTGEDCGAIPGTALYLQMTRKGVCSTVDHARPGRGSLR